MSNAAFYVLALTKLRQYTVAADELTRLGDLDAAENTEQSPSGVAQPLIRRPPPPSPPAALSPLFHQSTDRKITSVLPLGIP